VVFFGPDHILTSITLITAKEKAKSEGGTIQHEYTLIKGFTFSI
jgi:hypothetical protein